ncbi:iron-containing alcohol dehydrogenase [Paenactinomyces guangxiensis]|uniref:Iron-containing alcohol dehydrogenase n=1 Tax=Paenactinomyces guangxiensis TaxID=1490290 RepID=A0A7W1WR70_9BACL|nr:iron-containing alcohol dehydrogenase [Paenactinomyces guangxiensis]MBA4494458.1 iron-containing alcohol dehydrogenase [Paenactinomyces guangxiensis]MBH8591487.1 iron-containing alcohol dehydrogenase [Paenactinomyces guangxiensis]
MDTFVFHNPTKLIFGKGKLPALKEEVPVYGKKVLLVYGGGSIKRNGIYHETLQYLEEIDAEVLELAGVEPNPRLTTVQRGVEICKQEKVDFLLAVGGGSVIDATKAIAVGAKYDGNVWDIITKKVQPVDALPFGTVLTLAATGSEMNSGSVITNWETKEKLGWGTPLVYPKFSVLDPVHTFTVPRDQTVYGIVDMMSHALENYFSHSPNVPLQERMTESLLSTVIETAPKLLEDLENYEHRETIMFCGTMALNGMISQGMFGDWGTHGIEHAVSAVYDIPHGGGLAIIFPNWIRYNLDETTPKMKQLAVRVFNIDPAGKTDRQIAEEGIDQLRQFWSRIGAPSRLSDYGIDDSKLELMAQKAVDSGRVGRFKPLNKEDVLEILKMSL